MTKYFCDICGTELKRAKDGCGVIGSSIEYRKYTQRKNGAADCNYGGPNQLKKGYIDLSICHKCGDALEKSINDTIKKIKEGK